MTLYDPATEHMQALIGLYTQEGVTVDVLAYTPAFDTIYDELTRMGFVRSKATWFNLLLMLKKQGSLPQVSRNKGYSRDLD